MMQTAAITIHLSPLLPAPLTAAMVLSLLFTSVTAVTPRLGQGIEDDAVRNQDTHNFGESSF